MATKITKAKIIALGKIEAICSSPVHCGKSHVQTAFIHWNAYIILLFTKSVNGEMIPMMLKRKCVSLVTGLCYLSNTTSKSSRAWPVVSAKRTRRFPNRGSFFSGMVTTCSSLRASLPSSWTPEGSWIARVTFSSRPNSSALVMAIFPFCPLVSIAA